MVDWTRAEAPGGKVIDCRTCRHSAVDPMFTAVLVLMCSAPQIVHQPSGRPQSCKMARSPGGRCGPGARFLSSASPSPVPAMLWWRAPEG